jgi:hypothetical protein
VAGGRIVVDPPASAFADSTKSDKD